MFSQLEKALLGGSPKFIFLNCEFIWEIWAFIWGHLHSELRKKSEFFKEMSQIPLMYFLYDIQLYLV